MKKHTFKHLVAKLISEKRLSPNEFKAYRTELSSVEDEEIDAVLFDIWNNADDVEKMDLHVKRNILDNILVDILSSKNTRHLSWFSKVAMILIPLLVTLSIYMYSEYFNNIHSEYYTVITSKGQKSQILLPDGTKVWLNSDTELKYTSDYSRKDRVVSLKGNAFFEVAKDEKSKFVVQTSRVDVLVHGTEFNVSSYDQNEELTVSLLSGKVSILNNEDQSVIAELSPNHIARISKKSMLCTVGECDSELDSIWRNGILKFEGLNAEEMFKRIEHWYGVTITVENLEKEMSYGLTIKSESLRETLELLNLMKPIEYKISGEEVHIKYK